MSARYKHELFVNKRSYRLDTTEYHTITCNYVPTTATVVKHDREDSGSTNLR